MRVLVTWGSERGGTEGIAKIVGNTLREQGHEVDVSAPDAAKPSGYDAAIVGGALYANRWHRDARRFVLRHAKNLQRVPVWFFSSGPLDDSPSKHEIEPVRMVKSLMERVGAQGHVTFGGRLLPDAKGFLAGSMAKKYAGDFRNPERIRAWATDVARALPTARPRVPIEQAGHSFGRLFAHGAIGWAVCTAIMLLLLRASSESIAFVLHAITVPIVFTFVSRSYFREPGAREPRTTALAFALIFALLDLAIVSGIVQQSLAIFRSVAATWLPFVLLSLATWATGELMSTMPWTPPEAPREARR